MVFIVITLHHVINLQFGRNCGSWLHYELKKKPEKLTAAARHAFRLLIRHGRRPALKKKREKRKSKASFNTQSCFIRLTTIVKYNDKDARSVSAGCLSLREKKKRESALERGGKAVRGPLGKWLYGEATLNTFLSALLTLNRSPPQLRSQPGAMCPICSGACEVREGFDSNHHVQVETQTVHQPCNTLFRAKFPPLTLFLGCLASLASALANSVNNMTHTRDLPFSDRRFKTCSCGSNLQVNIVLLKYKNGHMGFGEAQLQSFPRLPSAAPFSPSL
eukprot:1149294-Pelagomonas_calceolata.AAC.6